MVRDSPVGNGSRGRFASDSWRGLTPRITTRHRLLHNSGRTADVEKLERAIVRFDADPMENHCAVALFEIAGDDYLHCNVTHRHATKTVTGWAGPGHVADGFVHNRRFGKTTHNDIVQHIREMVFAGRV